MVFLIILIFGCVILVPLVALAARAGLAIANISLGRIQSLLGRMTAWCLFIAATAAAAYPLIRVILPNLHDFRTQGDGGVGMAYNALALVATLLLTPAVICILFAGILYFVTVSVTFNATRNSR